VLFAAVLAELRTRRARGEFTWSTSGRYCKLVAGGRTVCLIHRQTEDGVKVQLVVASQDTITIHVTDMQSAGLVGYLIARASDKTSEPMN
jgi:hypothetical protein